MSNFNEPPFRKRMEQITAGLSQEKQTAIATEVMLEIKKLEDKNAMLWNETQTLQIVVSKLLQAMTLLDNLKAVG